MMRRILAAAFITSFLDAVTTYIVIVTGRGFEANPYMAFLNDAPEAVFFVQIIVVVGLACLLKIFEVLAAKLSVRLRMRIYNAASAVFAVVIACRAAAVVNNALIIFIGAAPLAGALYA